MKGKPMPTIVNTLTEDLKQGDEFVFAGQECVITDPIILLDDDNYTVHFAYIRSATYGTVIVPKSMRFEIIPGNL
jgi:hypothetical protein